MCSRITPQVNFVAGLPNRIPIANDHTTDRILAGCRFAAACKGNRPLHPRDIRGIPRQTNLP